MNATVSAQQGPLHQRVYVTEDLGEGHSVYSFSKELHNAGFHSIVLTDNCGCGSVAYYSPDNVAVGITETTAPCNEPRNEFRMRVFTANPPSEPALLRIRELEKNLSGVFKEVTSRKGALPVH